MRILYTGANGQLGRELTRRLAGTEHCGIDIADVDITNQAAVKKAVETYRPTVIIHGAAYTNVDGAEADPETAYRVNAIGTQNIAAACLHVGAKMVYVSTDYVFDGKLGRAYNEFDQTNPQSIYGKSKLAGEILAGQILNRLFVIRTAWLYGDGNNFVRTMLKLGREKKELRIVNDQFGCPTSTKDLAEAILRLCATEHYGTYHGTNKGVATWMEFAKEIFSLSGMKDVAVLPQTTAELGRPAPRPMYSPMDTMMLRLTVGDDCMRPWQEALAEYVENIKFEGETKV